MAFVVCWAELVSGWVEDISGRGRDRANVEDGVSRICPVAERAV